MMRRTTRLGLALWLMFGGSAVAELPVRVVSASLCTDQYVLPLADRSQIAGLSRLAADPFYSTYVELAAGIPTHRRTAEAVALMEPDLVIAGLYAPRSMIRMLKQLGIPILNIRSAKKLNDILPNIRTVADALGRPVRGRMLAEDLEEQINQFASSEQRATGALYRPGGYVMGMDTIVNDVMRAAGLGNLGAELGIRGEGRLSLEHLVMNPPDFLIVDSFRRDRPGVGQSVLWHPVLAKLSGPEGILEFPIKYWLCAGPPAIEGAERLSEEVTDRLKVSQPGNTP